MVSVISTPTVATRTDTRSGGVYFFVFLAVYIARECRVWGGRGPFPAGFGTSCGVLFRLSQRVTWLRVLFPQFRVSTFRCFFPSPMGFRSFRWMVFCLRQLLFAPKGRFRASVNVGVHVGLCHSCQDPIHCLASSFVVRPRGDFHFFPLAYSNVLVHFKHNKE